MVHLLCLRMGLWQSRRFSWFSPLFWINRLEINFLFLSMQCLFLALTFWIYGIVNLLGFSDLIVLKNCIALCKLKMHGRDVGTEGAGGQLWWSINPTTTGGDRLCPLITHTVILPDWTLRLIKWSLSNFALQHC